MNIANTNFQKFTKVPKELFIGSDNPYLASTFCYLTYRTCLGKVYMSLQDCLKWHHLNAESVRLTNHGYLTSAGKIKEALLILQELGYIDNFNVNGLKGNHMISFDFNEDNFNINTDYVIINNVEIETISDNYTDSRICFTEIIKVFLFLKSKIFKRLKLSDSSPMAMFIYYNNLSAITQLTLPRLKIILEYLTQCDLLTVLILPRKKYKDVYKTRPIFIAFNYDFVWDDKKLIINTNYDIYKEFIGAILKFESKGSINPSRHMKEKALILYSKSKKLGYEDMPLDNLFDETFGSNTVNIE